MNRVKLRRAAGIAIRCALALSLFTPTLPGAFAASAVDQAAECQYHIDLEYQLNMPIYHWAPVGEPKGVILALHGLVMHGQTFEQLGKNLADQGFLVYSTDMRGYGRLTKEYPHEFCSDKDCKQRVNYTKSAGDLLKLAEKLKKVHSGLPLYMVGESMGADMAIRIASARPDIADGLILSSPAIRAHHFIDKNTVRLLPIVMTNYKLPLDLNHYIQKYASEDPKVLTEMSRDPLLRRRMSTEELVASRRCINETLAFVPKISVKQPVLVLQSKDDKCVRADAVELLLAQLKSEDRQVRWFDERGHILIETAHIRPDTMETIVSWLNEHNKKSESAFHVGPLEELISEKPPFRELISERSNND